MSDQHSYVHPAFRGILNAIAPPEAPKVTGPALDDLTAYRKLVHRCADEAEGDGPWESRDLPALTDRDRALVLRSNVDAMQEVNLEPDALAKILAESTRRHGLAGLYDTLGRHLFEMLDKSIKHALLYTVHCEKEQRDEQDEIERDACSRDPLSSQERTAVELGVVQLLK